MIEAPRPLFEYQTKIEEVSLPVLGAPEPVRLQIETLENLDRTIDQLFTAIEKGADSRLLEDLCPYFGVLWAAGRGLAQYLAGELGHRLEGKRVLEVGCGLALPSLVAAKLGATVTATDFHPDVPYFLEKNKQRNNIWQLDYRVADWRKDETLGGFDWILGSDILYEKQHPHEVAQRLNELAGQRARIVVADPGRSYWNAFLEEMARVRRKPEVREIEVLEPRQIKVRDVANTRVDEAPTDAIHRRKVFLALI